MNIEEFEGISQEEVDRIEKELVDKITKITDNACKKANKLLNEYNLKAKMHIALEKK